MTSPRCRPLIGVTPDDGFSAERPGRPPAARYELKKAYPEAVLRAGGVPLVLPYADEASVVDAYLDTVDGLLVTGGAFDVDPALYGASRREGLGEVKQGRGAFEYLLLRGALDRGLPVLGICGGMQLLNVVAGGTLFQDLGRDRPGSLEHEQPHDPALPAHAVRVAGESKLVRICGVSEIAVNTTHHQAVDRVGAGLVACGWAEDGVVEAIESTGGPWRLGVQWHPELLDDAHAERLYAAFVQACR
jgi:putative glutamine amidotransferase